MILINYILLLESNHKKIEVENDIMAIKKESFEYKNTII